MRRPNPWKFLLAASLLAGPLPCPSSFANTFVAQGAYPGDTRAPVVAPGKPWRCIGKLSLPNHRFMTATLVGPDIILTAAHGLVKNGKLLPGNFIFRPDFGSPHNRTQDSATATRLWLGSLTPTLAACRHADWAILQLDTRLGDAYGTVRVQDADAAVLATNRRRYCLASYDRDFRHGAMTSWQTSGKFAALDPMGYLLHDFSTDRGASGAPIFYFSAFAQGARLVALNVAELTPHDQTLYGVPFTPQVANIAVASHEFFRTLQAVLAGDAITSATALRPQPRF
jgi:V8-like Glu-specific endopeptidase